MKALLFDGREALVTELPDPRPGPGEVLLRVAVAGICNTDLELVKGYMGFRGVLGHELLGRVEAGPREWLGRRVVAEINFACGRCERCRQGLGRHCPARRVMGIQGADGALAERVCVPLSVLHPVPDSLPDEAAVFTEPLAAAFEILEQVPVRSREPALVLGDGKLGLLAAQVLDRAGARVLAVGRHAAKLAILARRGIETRLAADWTPEPRFPLVVEATGRAAGFGHAVAATRPRGTLVLKSTLAHGASGPPVDLAPVVIHELQVLGSRCGPFAPALEALGGGEIDVASLVSDRLPIERGEQALQRAAESGVIKVLVGTRAPAEAAPQPLPSGAAGYPPLQPSRPEDPSAWPST